MSKRPSIPVSVRLVYVEQKSYLRKSAPGTRKILQQLHCRPWSPHSPTRLDRIGFEDAIWRSDSYDMGLARCRALQF